jgi:hypothetical protein
MSRPPRDDYYVLMWSFIDPLFVNGPEKAKQAIQRFRDLACNGGTLIATFVDLPSYHESLRQLGLPPITFTAQDLRTFPYLENDFSFYVENIVRALYRNWGEFKPLYRRQYETFARDRDPRVFQSPPCLNDPKVWSVTLERTADVMKGLEPARHLSLLYDLRDEPSITSFLLASDSCFCEHCLARMRDWLKTRYADLAALNAEWDTAFADWNQVMPHTTQEALERRAAGTWNFAPWADHREFMNETFARVCRELRNEIRRHDPEAQVGLAGTQCPSVFGGYDFARLVPLLDWAEPYDFGGSLDCFRSFKPRRAYPLLKTSGLGGDTAAVEAMLWQYLLQSGGYGGTIIWNSNTALDCASPALKPAKGARERARVYAELRTGAPRLLQLADEVSSPVAVHYSQASINADFITSVPHRWRSVAGYESHEYPAHQCRQAWWELLEDQGLRPTFISTRQIEAGELQTRGIRVLILPRSIALSDVEAAAMRRFVEDGGMLIGDSFIGRMDEHCRERAVGALDDLFGVRRSEGGHYHASRQRASYDFDVKPGTRPTWGSGRGRIVVPLIEECLEPAHDVRVLGCTEMTDTYLGFVAERGKGQAVLVNAAPIEYSMARRIAGGAKALTDFFGGFLAPADLQPVVQVLDVESGEALPGWRAWPFRHGAARYFGLAPDLQVAQDTFGAITVERGTTGRRPVDVRLAAAGHVYEVRTGTYLGRGRRVADVLLPTTARLYAVLPYRVRRLTIKWNGDTAAAALKVEGRGQIGEHVFRFDLTDAKGRRLLDGGANVVAPAGAAEWRPGTPLPRGGRLVCRDVATGVSATVTLKQRAHKETQE